MMNSEKSRSDLFAALSRAQARIKSVKHDGKNQHQRYTYATAEAIIAEARQALNAEGLALYCSGAEYVYSARHRDEFDVHSKESVNVKTGEIYENLNRRYHFDLVHSSGQSLEIRREMFAVEGKGRPIDKASCAADTTALAYVLRDLLLIPRSDNVEAIDQRDDRETTPAPKRAKPKEMSDLLGRIEKGINHIGVDRACEVLGLDAEGLANYRPATIEKAEADLLKLLEKARAV